jgi:RNA methyltransferase, TrmH family
VSELSKNKIKWIRSLQEKKYREAEGRFVVEGEKMVREALDLIPERVELVVHLHEFYPGELSCETLACNERELKQISFLQTPNKMLAVLKKGMNPLTQKGLVLALDGIQDPGNLGTIIRTADWFGLESIVCSTDTVDCYNPKVIQASMGSIYRVNLHYTDLHSFLSDSEKPIYGALLEGKNIYQMDLSNDGILLMGNEGKGIRPELISHIKVPITIPRFGMAESLNVAVATAILLSEFRNPK